MRMSLQIIRGKPEEPLPSDCCNSGCSPCVYDIYKKSIQEWERNENSSAIDTVNVRTDLLSVTRFKPFRLIKRQQITENVVIFSFQPFLEENSLEREKTLTRIFSNEMIEHINGILPCTVGQHLILRVYCEKKNRTGEGSSKMLESDSSNIIKLTGTPSDNNNVLITRAYTPITNTFKMHNCCFDVFAKLYKNGTMSNYLKGLQLGDIVYWRGPYGQFQYIPNSFSYVLMLCIGTGIAPMISIIQKIVCDELEDSFVHLMYGSKHVSDIIFRDELQKLTQFWNFTLEFYLSDQTAVEYISRFGEIFVHGKINGQSVEQNVTGKELNKLLVLICGTETFCENMVNIVMNMGVSMSNIYVF